MDAHTHPGSVRPGDPAVPTAVTEAVHAVGRVVVLVPTPGGFVAMPGGGLQRVPAPGCGRDGDHIPAAHEAGVTVRAGTDSHPCGTVAAEVASLISTGPTPEVAIGAASWAARSLLGLPGPVDGAPADLVAYDRDPVADPAVLAHPSRIILRGKVVR